MFDQSPFLKSNELQKDQDPLLKIVTHTRKQHPHVPNQNSFIHSHIHHLYTLDWQSAPNVNAQNIKLLDNNCGINIEHKIKKFLIWHLK